MTLIREGKRVGGLFSTRQERGGLVVLLRRTGGHRGLGGPRCRAGPLPSGSFVRHSGGRQSHRLRRLLPGGQPSAAGGWAVQRGPTLATGV